MDRENLQSLDDDSLFRIQNTISEIIKERNFQKGDIEAIIDDTDENFSSKIKKMNLIGAPFQIIIGKQAQGDLVEFKETGQESKKLKLEEVIKIIKEEKVKN